MNHLENLFDGVGELAESIIKERLYVISILSGILFYILANTNTFSTVEKLFSKVFNIIGIKFKLKGNNLLLFHSLVFTILMSFMLYIILEPVVKTINKSIGQDDEKKDQVN